MKNKLLVFGVLASMTMMFIGGRAGAQSTPAPNGVTVSPAIQQVVIAPGQDTAVFNITVTNNTSSPVVLNVGAQDFTSLNQSGGLSFFKSNPINTNNPHGLVNFLSLGYKNIALAPKQSQNVPITVINAQQLATGGHYTAITFQITGTSNGGVNKVLINQVVSSLVFLSTAGEGTQSTKLLTVPLISSFYASMPNNIPMVIGNNGNTQTVPRGYAVILNSSGEVVSQGQINIDSNLILPSSTRLFTLSLSKATKRIMPGFYTLKVYYLHDGQEKYTVYSQKFFYFGWSYIIFIVILLTLVLGIIGFYTMTEPLQPVNKPAKKQGSSKVNSSSKKSGSQKAKK